ncbi:kinase [Sphingopyxis panaciterrulae]|uniref:kinase n=1 Tax=Sphingopyxis panaciterrulae TaxID=462372 RepID=UPI00161C9F3D
MAATAILGWAAEPDAPRPLVVGLCGAQGSGKSTLAAALADRLTAAGHRTAILALDDLYLPAAERAALARTVHPLLRVRGVPGTHDPERGLALLDRLGQPGPVVLPRFDKATDDRAAPATVAGPFDIILFEGWCVGAAPQAAADLADPVNALEAEADAHGVWRRHVNAALAGPYRALSDRIDRLILLAAPGFEVVHRWRLQQEEALRTLQPEGAGLMDAAAVGVFIQYYERLTRHILTEMPGRADLTLHLDPDRRVIRADSKDISR